MIDPRPSILWFAAQRRLRLDRPFVLAVGGGIGKTSTKVAIGTLFNLKYPGQVRVGYGNLNTYLGVPLAVLGFEVDFYKQKIGVWAWLKILGAALWRSWFSKLPPYLILEFGTDQP